MVACGSHREHGWLDGWGVVRIYISPFAALLLISCGYLGHCLLHLVVMELARSRLGFSTVFTLKGSTAT